MLIDVEDPLRKLILNCSLIAVVQIAIVAIVPWGTLGAERIDRLATMLPIPTLAIAFVYEGAMPSRYDIRLDLVLLANVWPGITRYIDASRCAVDGSPEAPGGT